MIVIHKTSDYGGFRWPAVERLPSADNAPVPGYSFASALGAGKY